VSPQLPETLVRPHRQEPTWLAPAATVVGILALASIPGVPAEEVDGRFSIAALPPTLQNALHIPLYGGITWIWLRALHRIRHHAAQLALGASTALAIGTLDELRQGFVPGRYASLTDMALNATGIALALLLWHRSTLPRRHTPSP